MLLNTRTRAAIIGGIITSLVIAVFVISLNSNIFKQSNTQQNSIQNNVGITSKLKVVASFFPLYEFARNVGVAKLKSIVFFQLEMNHTHGNQVFKK